VKKTVLISSLTVSCILIFTAIFFNQPGAQPGAPNQITDTITLKHKFYTTTYDTVKRYPILVQWLMTKSMLNCPIRLKRGNDFEPDPLLPQYTNLKADYPGSGYDRGHNMDAFDNECDMTGLIECFYFSNICPQAPRLNRGDWKALEEYTRKQVLANDSIYVWCGSIGNLKKIKSFTVPIQCWKVLYTKKTDKYEAFLFNNDNSNPRGIDGHRVSCDSIFKLTGIKTNH
jgi:endonuclease G, mitochondrial